MRVLHLVQELRRGGAETVVRDLIAAQQEQGHEVGLAAHPGPWSAAFDPVVAPLPMVRRSPAQLALAGRSARRAVRAFGPDVVHAHNPTMGALAAMGSVGVRGVRRVTTVHGLAESDYAAGCRMLRWAGGDVIGCGPGVSAALRRHGLAAGTVVNGVLPAPAVADLGSLAARWLRPGTSTLLVSVGRLAPQKRHDRAIAALTQLPHATLLVVGEGELHDELAARAEALGVSDRLVLAGLRDDARELMAAADVVLMLSDWEGLPLTLLEAMAAATPIIATAVRGIRELLDDGSNALLVAPDDQAALTTAIHRITHEPQLRATLVAGAQEHARRYTVDAMATAYLDHYRKGA